MGHFYVNQDCLGQDGVDHQVIFGHQDCLRQIEDDLGSVLHGSVDIGPASRGIESTVSYDALMSIFQYY